MGNYGSSEIQFNSGQIQIISLGAGDFESPFSASPATSTRVKCDYSADFYRIISSFHK